jgi:hypothetical protein
MRSLGSRMAISIKKLAKIVKYNVWLCAIVSSMIAQWQKTAQSNSLI